MHDAAVKYLCDGREAWLLLDVIKSSRVAFFISDIFRRVPSGIGSMYAGNQIHSVD